MDRRCPNDKIIFAQIDNVSQKMGGGGSHPPVRYVKSINMNYSSAKAQEPGYEVVNQPDFFRNLAIFGLVNGRRVFREGFINNLCAGLQVY